MYEIEIYTRQSGKSPLIKFIDSQSHRDKAKIIRHIDMLEKYGLALTEPYAKKIATNIYELRILGNSNIRILYTYHQGHFLLLHAFKKKSQHLPQKEIKLALARIRQLL